MTDILVKVRTETLNIGQGKSRLITGEICLAIGDVFFPELYWNDFVVIVLTWWLDAINKLKKSAIGEVCEFRFMDGPFFASGVKIDQKTIAMNFMKGRMNGDDMLFSSENCSIDNLTHSLFVASSNVIEEIDKRKWDNKDIADLRRAMKII
ncbi:hypothetical protein [Methylomusa anaerophila]|uniref:Uncharacterized protein n=1 Tax=Methylomusa anaerophila TaxID=1930071 RepID=A0A348AH86_9FIRM|nr:hypothetical protein [Methylomusa anaerophila]BBB90434.1 hypothetical protein MAMMFC1_01085 [Methylomusa anaerophila]